VLLYFCNKNATRRTVEVIAIRKRKKLIFNCFTKREECIFCNEIKNTYLKICKACLVKCLTPELCFRYLAHQTKLAKKHFNYDYKKELSEEYFKKYNKKFNSNNKRSKKFLKHYCLSDEVSLIDYIRNGGK